ncbi:hypothetical protein [Sphingomonas sp.]|uniref:hypothetical protein n=1 Tax=Sphingomonas sp. TaxID=28214 RepID=UPI001E013FED|nr:hypothetical protein [Sphingomonas sp.]MBX9797456.1 hypothetical protein [Sphingomonas sp.]
MYENFDSFGELLESGENIENLESWDSFDSSEAGESFESSERNRRRNWRPVPTPRVGNPVPRPASQGWATKAELQATAQRLDARIATNARAIRTLDGRTRTLETEAGRLRAELRREVTERRNVTDALRRGLDESRQIAMLIPLLSSTTTQTVGGVDNVVVDSGDQLSKVLPILLLSGGFGGSSGTTGTSGGSGGGILGGGDNSFATFALVMALAGGKK